MSPVPRAVLGVALILVALTLGARLLLTSPQRGLAHCLEPRWELLDTTCAEGAR